jgi:hypothetical protein
LYNDKERSFEEFKQIVERNKLKSPENTNIENYLNRIEQRIEFVK